MRGVLLEEVIDKYVEAYGQQFIDLFNNIYENQEEAYVSYGDCDYAVTKLKVNGGLADKFVYPENEFEETTRAILLDNIFSDDYFLIIENSVNHKNNKFGNAEYFVYKLNKRSEVKSLNLEKSKLLSNLNRDNLVVHYENFMLKRIRLRNNSINHKVFRIMMFTFFAIEKRKD